MSTQPLSLRERKKLATRNALIASARRLFAEKGYENTTLEQICEDVQIHVTTFFSYFESKEELAFARSLEALELLRQKVESRSPETDVLSVWWEFLDRFDSDEREEEGSSVARLDRVPALRNRFAVIQRQYQDVLAAALAKEAGKEPGADLYSELQAAVLMSTLVTASRWYRGETAAVARADTAVFARMVVSHLPPRSAIEVEVKRLTAASGRKGDRGRPRHGRGTATT